MRGRGAVDLGVLDLYRTTPGALDDRQLGDALARLRAHAFAHQRPLLVVAHDVVERHLVFTEDVT